MSQSLLGGLLMKNDNDLVTNLFLFGLLLFGIVLVFFKQIEAAIYTNTLVIAIRVLLLQEDK